MKWANLSEFENSWELKSNIQREFPDFHLEDKVDLQGGVLIQTPGLARFILGRRKEVMGCF